MLPGLQWLMFLDPSLCNRKKTYRKRGKQWTVTTNTTLTTQQYQRTCSTEDKLIVLIEITVQILTQISKRTIELVKSKRGSIKEQCQPRPSRSDILVICINHVFFFSTLLLVPQHLIIILKWTKDRQLTEYRIDRAAYWVGSSQI